MPLTGQAKTDYQRDYMRQRRSNPDIRQGERLTAKLRARSNNGSNGKHCEVCGFSETIDLHHEGEKREEHWLCPSCHALITRGIKTLEELMGSNVRPKLAALRAIMDDIKSKPSVPSPFIPRYQIGVSKTGDRVRMPDGSIVTVPELDGEGNPIGW